LPVSPKIISTKTKKALSGDAVSLGSALLMVSPTYVQNIRLIKIAYTVNLGLVNEPQLHVSAIYLNI
jgi:hypothetical protein